MKLCWSLPLCWFVIACGDSSSGDDVAVDAGIDAYGGLVQCAALFCVLSGQFPLLSQH